MADLLAHLNPQQRAAVTVPGGHALILAGAGSGKTRVLTTRIAWLVGSGQCSPSGIMAVTFTNKAAREMMARLGAMLMSANPRAMWVGTFHGLCNRLLRAHHRDAGLPASFQIMDGSDQLGAIKRLLRGLNVDDQKFQPKAVQHFINGSKEAGLRAADVPTGDAHSRRLVELYAAYDEQCQREGVVDFAELLLRAYELLKRNQPLRQHYQQRFRHILIDEFQDTNDLQYRWLTLLAAGGASLFAVGDDDQSIYAFRGANVGNMAAFERDYAGPQLIRLEQNYRSHAHILDSANHLIRQNTGRLGKDLWTDAGEGEPVRVFAGFSDRDEGNWILDEIRALVADGMERSEIAILYRANAQSRILEHTLFSAGVPYQVYGGLRFFERAEIKHALAYLRLIENPDDDGAFLRVVNFPARGIGARTLESLQDTARTHGISLYRAVPMTSGAGGTRLLQFVRLIELMRQNSARLPLSESIDDVIGRSGLMAHYEQEREGQERIENLKELVNAALAFQAEGGIDAATPASAGLAGTTQPAADGAVLPADAAPVVQVSPLAAFLAHASLESGDGQAEEGVDAVQLMTVHAAKGLEFETVFVTGLEEGLFPHENSASDPGGLEEERRLMYVAMTRARRRLYLSLAQTRMLHGQTRYNMQSRFLSELPERSLKWLSEMPSASAQGSLGLGAERGSRGYYGGGGYGGGGYGSGGGNGGGNWRPRLDSAVHERNRQSGWVRPADPSIPASGDASGKARAGRDSRYHIGQSLRHARFGEGVVTGIEGNGDDARIQIRFKAPHGIKWLALAVAKLEPV
ncbi:DNA helicase II [Lautropia dentalis]|uniref:DNA 3'-5' helicase n=1 Tax=Lautropia dentalis TaxID=2490857 RepID=A0A3R8NCR9_9BURK|nr:UvrD-helicase domain-containing protein [Lautropia dentalis]RRN45635.1 DNA helicase II [Lautropia dentalis]